MVFRTVLLACWAMSCLVASEPVQKVSIVPNEMTVNLGQSSNFSVVTSGVLTENITIRLDLNYPDIVKVEPSEIHVLSGTQNGSWNIYLHTLHVGHAKIMTNVTPRAKISDEDGFLDIKVQHYHLLGVVSFVIGWVYFAAWSVSFYPQIIENWKRKSVVGLNFDFLALNLIGFTLYSVFNCALFWIAAMEDQYHLRYPRSLKPVLLNDVVFSLHAMLACIITIIQCFFYERGGQTVSIVARSIIGVFGVIVLVSALCARFKAFLWLDFIYICSYIKLTITLIKYMPQAYMNFRRKSTVGWSIGNILLDFTGGLLSMSQMIINAYNFDDWESIFGDPVKFGLGLFSVVFDIFFMVQHFILYRNRPDNYEELEGDNIPAPDDTAAAATTETASTSLPPEDLDSVVA